MREFESNDEISDAVEAGNHGDCITNAHNLFDFYNNELKSFPLFWDLIQFDRENLAVIFDFFCEALSIQESHDTEEVVVMLGERLAARWSGTLLPLPTDLSDRIEVLSRGLMNAVLVLDAQQLVSPAFELFAAGALSLKHPQFMTVPPSETLSSSGAAASVVADPEPDSGGYFYWAEFALLAAQMGFQAEQWKGVLPVLLRTERIFALCYGNSQNGVIPATRRFQDYTFGGFTMLHPDVAKAIPLSNATSLDELEVEATAAARFAFPGEFASS